MVFPLIHQILDFERQAAYVSGRLRAAVKTWYNRKPVSKAVEQAFVEGIETELVSNDYSNMCSVLIYDIYEMACSTIIGWSVMGDRRCALPTFAHRLLLQRHFEIESRAGHREIRSLPLWPREEAEHLCCAKPDDEDKELPIYTYAWWKMEVPTFITSFTKSGSLHLTSPAAIFAIASMPAAKRLGWMRAKVAPINANDSTMS